MAKSTDLRIHIERAEAALVALNEALARGREALAALDVSFRQSADTIDKVMKETIAIENDQ